MPKLPLIHATRVLHPDARFPIEQVDLEFSNGVRRTYERQAARGRGAVAIVAMRDPDTFLLVREYVCGLHAYELGLPKGRVERGEDILEAANRELKEEVGVGAHRLTLIKRLSLAPTYMSHRTDIVLAEDLYDERLEGDEPEELEVVPWPVADLDALLMREDVTEGRSIAALFTARAYLKARAEGRNWT
ncbi:ADP compounds hydrolase NudE [Ahniella affigens]|uniref:ADP compounds hydrolase NudE n=1 Tax=Ahniella affigens TaxID=2021234 RepID=A0A2P1PNQ5_9GAMM|nr:ADP compounds hydrolase NudE [Ahniella affigens]AVP96465.1 ADP compounds hydrolase NudE [Ahniella affigens]